MADKDVNITLHVKMDGNGAAGIKGLADAAKSAKSGLGGDKKKEPAGLGGRITESLGKMGGGAGNLAKLAGAAGPAAAAVGAAAGAYALTVVAAGKAADAIGILGNKSATSAQKMEQLTDQFIPGAESFRRFGEALAGTTERLRQAELAHELNTRQIRLEAEARSKRSESLSQISGNASRAQAFGGPISGGPIGYDRSTVDGEQKQLDEDRRAAARANVEQAQMNAQAARTASAAQDRALANSEAQRKKGQQSEKSAASTVLGKRQAENDRPAVTPGGAAKSVGIGALGLPAMLVAQGMGNGLNGGRDKAGMKEALNKQEQENLRVGLSSKQNEAEINRTIEKRKGLLESESQLRKAMIDQQKVELTLLQEKEARMSSTQTQLGLMNKGEYEQAKQAALALKQIGVENASDDLKNLARPILGSELDKMGEKAGKSRAEELQGLGFQRFQSDYGTGKPDLEAIRMEVDKQKVKVDMTIKLDSQQLAVETAKELNPLFRQLIKELTVQVAAGLREARIGQAQKQESK